MISTASNTPSAPAARPRRMRTLRASVGGGASGVEVSPLVTVAPVLEGALPPRLCSTSSKFQCQRSSTGSRC